MVVDVIGPFTSFMIALVIGIVAGVAFMVITGDSRFKLNRDGGLGVVGSLIGWGFAMLLPLREYKNSGADFVAFAAVITFLRFYWAVFKERSNLIKDFDANAPRNLFSEQERP